MENKKGKVITVFSTKGGVGKTVTIVNLAYLYEKMGLKTLILDLDLFSGAIATYLNSSLDKTIYNLVEDLANNKYKTIDDYTFKFNPNISLIASPKDPRNSRKIEAKYIPLILRNAIYKYDVILIDTTHAYSDINLCALDNSDSILYMFTNDLFDLKNTTSFMTILNDLNYKNCYVVLNESIRPGRSYYSMYDIRSIIKHNVDFTINKSNYIRNIDKVVADSKGSFMKIKDIASKLIEDKEDSHE
jgi:Flp pilus assembly protein, ATPase CpaE